MAKARLHAHLADGGLDHWPARAGGGSEASGLRSAYDQVLPGWREADVGGSPYAIGDYQVPPALGGEAGLRQFRQKLRTSMG